MPKCKICGARLAEGAAVCPVCGAGGDGTVPPRIAEGSPLRIGCCPFCGQAVISEHRFCPKCGRNLEGAGAGATTVTAPLQRENKTAETHAKRPLESPAVESEAGAPSFKRTGEDNGDDRLHAISGGDKASEEKDPPLWFRKIYVIWTVIAIFAWSVIFACITCAGDVGYITVSLVFFGGLVLVVGSILLLYKWGKKMGLDMDRPWS